jgi:hypothetical protein
MAIIFKLFPGIDSHLNFAFYVKILPNGRYIGLNPKYALAILLRDLFASKSVTALLFSTSL